jgi:hypothetical protein
VSRPVLTSLVLVLTLPLRVGGGAAPCLAGWLVRLTRSHFPPPAEWTRPTGQSTVGHGAARGALVDGSLGGCQRGIVQLYFWLVAREPEPLSATGGWGRDGLGRTSASWPRPSLGA